MRKMISANFNFIVFDGEVDQVIPLILNCKAPNY
jgi:hypothetical protein